MTDYTKLTDFASKDTLPTGNAAKIVKGTEIDDEFEAIETAVATKADLNSPVLIGTPTAPTASAGTYSTQLATTAFVLNAVYPVGSIYINATSSTNPATLFGFGTWVEFGSGKVLVSQDTGDTAFDTLEETGGSKDAVVVSHNHTITDPGHSHKIQAGTGSVSDFLGGSDANYGLSTGSQQNVGMETKTTGITIDSEGVSGTDANLQPYIVVKMWKRTA